MIKTRFGVTEIRGIRAEVIADIAVIFRSLLKETDITREEIIEALDDAEKSASEIDGEIKNIDEEIEQKIKEMEEGTK